MPRVGVPMRTFIASSLVCMGLVACALPSSAAPARTGYRLSRQATPPDSYLEYRVYTVDQLIQQVATNPAVRERFARHFHVPENRVVSYMRHNLVESYIPKTSRYTVYCVRPSGKFFAVRQTFRQGTKVFALRNGEPVMKWICGNPLSKFLPTVQVVQKPPPVVHVSPEIQELTPSEMTNVLVPAEMQVPVYQPLVPFNVASASTSVFHGGASLLPLLLPVALLGVHSGSSPHTPVPAVPEAGSLAYLVLVLPFVGMTLRRRMSARKPG